jgi:hypothetical protein
MNDVCDIVVRQQAEARSDAVRVASWLREPSRRLLVPSVQVTRRDVYQLLRCHGGKYSIDLLTVNTLLADIN